MVVLIVATIALAAAIFVGTIALVLLDEMRRPSSEIRRLGGLLALVAGGAGMWLLISAVEVNGVSCGTAVGVIQEFLDKTVQSAGCSDARFLHVLLSAACILGGTVLVLFTRRDWAGEKAAQTARNSA